jgi:hypothetical protein
MELQNSPDFSEDNDLTESDAGTQKLFCDRLLAAGNFLVILAFGDPTTFFSVEIRGTPTRWVRRESGATATLLECGLAYRRLRKFHCERPSLVYLRTRTGILRAQTGFHFTLIGG